MKIFTFLLFVLLSIFSNKAIAQRTRTYSTVTTTRESKNGTTVTVDTRENENWNKKEVSIELDVTDKNDVSIENTYRTIVVKTWKEKKVKVSTVVLYEGENKLTDDEWFGKLNLNSKIITRGNKSSIRIKSGVVSGNNYFEETSSNLAIFNGKGEHVKDLENRKRVVIVTIPASANLEVDSKYAELQLENNMTEVKISITNGNVEMQDAASLILRSKYSNISAGDIANAEVEITNGKFAAKNIATLDIDSKYSSVEVGDVATATIRSTNDSYEMEEVATFTGRKNYGSLRIEKLNQSFEFEGTNADVKIKSVAPTLKIVNIDNKYGDIRLPLKQLTDYTVRFDGAYSTVYGNFEKKKWEENAAVSASAGKTRYPNSSSDDCSCDSKFTATVGNKDGAKIIVKCQNCTVDFK